MKKENVYDILLSLHKWREKFNGDHIGFGHDQYKPDKLFHYPEAYAVWGLGYLNLYKITEKKEFLKNAIKCADWLIKNKNPNYKNMSWGLPWNWEYWNAPKDLSYLITTVFCGDFLLESYKETLNNKYLESAINVGEWIEKENSGEMTKKGLFFYYANFPSLKFQIPNPTAKSSAFFGKLYMATGNKMYRDLCFKSAEYTLKSQNPDGSWYYSERSNIIDNFHTGLILDALLDLYYLQLFDKKSLYESLKIGFSFYWHYLFKKNGAGIEVYKKNKTLKERIYNFFNLDMNDSRLWSYGVAIKVFSKAIPILKTEEYATKIFNYSLKLRQHDGAFCHKINDHRTFIRGEAHMFNGLIYYFLYVNDKIIF